MSDLRIASVAALLVEYGLLGLLMTMPPALLFGLGFRSKKRITLAFTGALFLALGVVVFGITLHGIDSGSGLALSRGTLMVELAERPTLFWVSTVAFVGISVAIVAAGVFCLWSAWRPRRPSAGN